jgi:acetyltransferase-like isoleucine patch superfamily enzyme
MSEPDVKPNRPGFLKKARSKIMRYYNYYIVCKGDNARYLRLQGARIGQGCDLLNNEGFGSEPWLIELGDRVTLAEGVRLITHDGSSRLFRHHIPKSSRYGNRFGTIRIRNDCFVGTNAIILPDVSIGPYSIVGAGSVVTKDVPPYTVVAGVPAKPICSLEEYIASYQQKMIPTMAEDRETLRRELTLRLWGEER